MNIIGVIPARLKSRRLAEKMLIRVKGKAVIERVYLNMRGAKMLRELYVATDSPKIKKVIEAAGGKVIMTPSSCKSGTERIREALKSLKANINDIIVNIQGDEPLLEAALVDKMAAALLKDRTCDAATLASPITDPKDVTDPSCVKVTVDTAGRAVYFSRAPIPFSRDGKFTRGLYLRHIGVYAYRKYVLDKWNSMKSAYENIEKLEQLKMTENGYKIKVVTGRSRSVAIDTKKDLVKFKKALKK